MTLRKGRGKAQDPCCPPRKRPLVIPISVVPCCPIPGISSDSTNKFVEDYNSLAAFSQLVTFGAGGVASVSGGIATLQNNMNGGLQLLGSSLLINPVTQAWCFCLRADFSAVVNGDLLAGLFSAKPGFGFAGGNFNGIAIFADAANFQIVMGDAPAAPGVVNTGIPFTPGFHDFKVCHEAGDPNTVTLQVDDGTPVVATPGAGTMPSELLPMSFAAEAFAAINTLQLDRFCAEAV